MDRTARSALISIVGAAALSLSACGHFGILVKKKEATPEPESVDSSLSALRDDPGPVDGAGAPAPEPSTDDRVAESARLLDEYLSGIDDAPPDDPPVRDNEPATRVTRIETPAIADPDAPMIEDADPDPDTELEPRDGASFSLAQASEESGAPIGETPEPEPEPAEPGPAEPESTPEERKERLVGELVEVLTRLAQGPGDPSAHAAALAALDTMRPGALAALEREGLLSPTEIATLGAAREVLDAVTGSGSLAPPGRVVDVLERVREDLEARAGLRVTRAVLCTRVDGFGRFEPFVGSAFTAGFAHEVIVYAEVDRFGHREVSGSDGEPRYEVELSQRLELYHIADDLNTWNRATERVAETSRNKLRDFYLTNTITLPSTLAAGRYHLKVVMRDLVRDQVAERIIPIRILAR